MLAWVAPLDFPSASDTRVFDIPSPGLSWSLSLSSGFGLPPLDSALRISFPMPFPLVPFLFLSLFSTIPGSLKKKYTSVHCCANSPTNVSSPGPVHAVLLSFDPPALHTNRWTPTLIHPVIVRSCLDCAKRSYVPGSSADQLRHRSLIGAAGQLLASFLDRLFP